MLVSLEADVDLDTRLLGWGTGLFFLVSSVDDEDKVTLSLGLGIGSVNVTDCYQDIVIKLHWREKIFFWIFLVFSGGN